MKKLIGLFIMLASLVLATTSFATTINFEWDRNTETDMNHYTMYKCPSSTACGLGSGRTSVGTIPQPGSGTVVDWSYVFTPPAGTEETEYFACTATDNSGNESTGTSNIVSTRVDNKPPLAPGGALKILNVLP